MSIKGIVGDLADRYYFFGNIRYQLFKLENYRKYRQSEEARIERSKDVFDERYTKLLALKNHYHDQRCFIVATGPSLKISDLELLRDQITFGVNSICKVFSMTSWRPTYFGIQDRFVYEKLEKDIIENFTGNAFVADTLSDYFVLPDCFIQYPYLGYYKYYLNKYKQYGAKFSDNAYAAVYDGYSITYSMIQIAVYMGFKKIYLLGCDCNYTKGGNNHFIESGHVDKNDYLNYEKMTAAYKSAKEYMDSHDVEIINCTRGGMLEVFPRKSLEEVLDITGTEEATKNE